jgi:transketolase
MPRKGSILQKEQLAALEETARNLRISVIRTLHRSQSGHTGGSLSALDVVTAL